MKTSFAAMLLAATFISPAFAAEFTPASRIDAVTVFPQGADVVRTLDVDVPAGEHSLILAGLPQGVDPQSIRVEGDASGTLLVGSVDTRNAFQGENNDAKRKPLEDQLEALQFERQALDLTIGDLTQQRAILLNLADKQLVPQSTTDTTKAIDAAQLGALVDLVGTKLSALGKDMLAAQKRQRAIDEETAKLQAQIEELAPNEDYRTQVVLNVEATEASKATLRVSYRVAEAAWSPFYDARLAIGDGKSKPKLELVQRAEVTQSTGETWDNVALTLSTARPGGATAAPQIASVEVRKLEPVVPMADAVMAPAPVAEAEMRLENDGGTGALKSRTLRLAKPKAILQKQAVVETAGFQATYAIAGRVSVDNSGQSKKVRMATQALDATLTALVVPRVDTTAYLTGSFTLAGQGPQLPGLVNLYRDGVYVGQGGLPLLSPGEEAKLGFGADDLVKVTRAEVKRVTGEEGIISSSNVDERGWDITVKSLHDVAMNVRVLDRVPFTASKEISIEDIVGMTPPTVRDLDKQRGVLAWDFTLEPKAENALKTGYKISWPKDMDVNVVD